MFLPGSGQIQVSYYGIVDQTTPDTPEEALQFITSQLRSRVQNFLIANKIKDWDDLEKLNWATAELHQYGHRTHHALSQIAPIDIPKYSDLEKIGRRYWGGKRE